MRWKLNEQAMCHTSGVVGSVLQAASKIKDQALKLAFYSATLKLGINFVT